MLCGPSDLYSVPVFCCVVESNGDTIVKLHLWLLAVCVLGWYFRFPARVTQMDFRSDS